MPACSRPLEGDARQGSTEPSEPLTRLAYLSLVDLACGVRESFVLVLPLCSSNADARVEFNLKIAVLDKRIHCLRGCSIPGLCDGVPVMRGADRCAVSSAIGNEL